MKTELMSGRIGQPDLADIFAASPMLEIRTGFWERAGETRRLLFSKDLKAKLADTLIAQCCIDAGVSLIARDGDFRHFAKWCGLKLAG